MANVTKIKKGDMVTLRMFTGAIVGGFKVEKADAKTLSFTNKKGILMTFDKKTGKQVEPAPKSDKFANTVDEYDEGEVAEALKKRSANLSKATSKAVAKRAEERKKADPIEELDPVEDEDDDDEVPEEHPVNRLPKKVIKKKVVKKAAKPVEPEDDDDEDDGFEELD